jgi:1-acyl-sn-glycerol-3-phosphate acyltransferase
LLPFHANLIQAAISAGAPAQPVALSFLDTRTRAPSLAPCYVDDDTLVMSVWRTVSAPPVTAVVHYGEPQAAQGRDRRTWARDLRSAVDALRQS